MHDHLSMCSKCLWHRVCTSISFTFRCPGYATSELETNTFLAFVICSYFVITILISGYQNSSYLQVWSDSEMTMSWLWLNYALKRAFSQFRPIFFNCIIVVTNNLWVYHTPWMQTETFLTLSNNLSHISEKYDLQWFCLSFLSVSWHQKYRAVGGSD